MECVCVANVKEACVCVCVCVCERSDLRMIHRLVLFTSPYAPLRPVKASVARLLSSPIFHSQGEMDARTSLRNTTHKTRNILVSSLLSDKSTDT